ncbi:response regulator [Pseudoalteromonas sp. MMG010]|uniref:ATP-binding protein n=1 Tax=Pseudoalteromonas sp. MMG010 TaxID=2822685 RepID=UPI001B3A30D5|nr:ATP-binding protein [Pseudoalteromonas sp. MMG010]MBQ4832729.1 response regulator [Pseudoalteromonas sp. MMG010]
MKINSIKSKVILTLSVLVILLIAQSYTFNISQKQLYTLQVDQHQALEQSDNITELENHILSLQSQANLYTNNPHEYTVDKLHHYLDLAKQDINALDKHAIEHNSHYQKSLSKLFEYLNNYQDTFNQVVLNKKQRESLYQQQFQAPLNQLKKDLVAKQKTASDEQKSDYVDIILLITNIEQNTQSYLYNPAFDKSNSTQLNLHHLQLKLSADPILLNDKMYIVSQLERTQKKLVTLTRGYSYSIKVVLTGIENELLYLVGNIKKIEQKKLANTENQLSLTLEKNIRHSNIFIIFSTSLVLIIILFMIRSVIRPISKLTQLLNDMANNKAVVLEKNKTQSSEIKTAIVAANTLYLNNKHNTDLLVETQNLNSQLQTSNNQLENAIAEARVANKAKNDFTANISHELRTPMNGVLGMLQLLKDSPLPSNQRNYAEKALSSAQGLLTTLNDILSFAKLESQQFQREETTFTLQSVITQASNLFLHIATHKGIKLEFISHTDTKIKLLGDPLHLGQIINNCIANAIKFTEQGHVQLIIDISAQHNNTIHYTFRIKDTGIGIRQSQISEIFKSFHQGDSTTTRRYGGTGLGLTISQQLTELLGGELNVKSQWGKGSEFYFTLPFVLETTTKKEKRALIINPNDSQITRLGDLLVKAGFTAQISHEPFRALSMLKHNSHVFSTIILHIKHHEMENNYLFQQLKTYPNEHNNDLSVIAILADCSTSNLTHSSHIKLLGNDYSDPQLLRLLLPSKQLDINLAIENKIFAGHTALVVDDNPVNQDVVCAMLEKLSINVITAPNGKEAIEKACQNTVHIIFMDIQMPILDGLETTKILRSKGCKLPIIATTAAAFPKDKQAAFDSGMNDFIAKPIIFDDFFFIIAKHVSNIYRPQMINVTTALENVDHDQAVLLNVLNKFYIDYKNFNAQVSTQLNAEQHHKLVSDIHTLKGLSGTLGLEQLTHVIHKVEESLKQQSFFELGELTHTLTLTLKAIEQYTIMKDVNITSNTLIEGDSLDTILKQIYDLAVQSKPISNQLVIKLNPFITQQSSSLLALKEAINNFNYQMIIEIIAEYQNKNKGYEKPLN